MSYTNPLLLQSKTSNPYRYAAEAILNRMKWDLNPESWRSRKLLQKLNDKNTGEKAVIICNGPSLLKANLSLLDNVFTFGLNKINLLFDSSNFRPSCITAINSYVIDQNKDFYNKTDIPLFINGQCSSLVKSRKDVVFLHLDQRPKFASDCSISMFHGHTVTYTAMQIAYHMGFSDVALIGCDHNFVSKGAANSLVISKERDENHFHPAYFSGGVQWQLPDLVNSEKAYWLAKNMYEANNRKIVNCTDGGDLDIFERSNLEQWLKTS
jgi:hypothetical protein